MLITNHMKVQSIYNSQDILEIQSIVRLHMENVFSVATRGSNPQILKCDFKALSCCYSVSALSVMYGTMGQTAVPVTN